MAKSHSVNISATLLEACTIEAEGFLITTGIRLRRAVAGEVCETQKGSGIVTGSAWSGGGGGGCRFDSSYS
jgi:hypothetical protein